MVIAHHPGREIGPAITFGPIAIPQPGSTMTNANPDEARLREKYADEIACVARRFESGLTRIIDPKTMRRAYDSFRREGDPIYSAFMEGLGHDIVSRSFFTFWRAGQTFATQARFWLEEAIADLLIQKYRRAQRNNVRVYTQAMLSAGWHALELRVCDFGDTQREALAANKLWKVQIQRSALGRIDMLVGEEERSLANRTDEEKRAGRSAPIEQMKDEHAFQSVIESLTGPPAEFVHVQCNLLVIEPDRLDTGPHAWGIRFANAKTLTSHGIRKQERVNLLRLHAYLAQEKPLRDPRQIKTVVAEIIPRSGSKGDPYPDYFTPFSLWKSSQFWDFLKLPYNIVPLGIRDAAGRTRQAFAQGMIETLTPDA